MAKTIGLSRAVKLEWLDRTVDLVLEGMDPEDIKKSLNNFIALDISSPDNIRKTRDILMNIWVHPFEDQKCNDIRASAIKNIKNGTEDRALMHWCMLLLYYPVFVDVTGMIGKISDMQDSFTLAWLKDKMFEEWGERTTLFHSLDKIMQTLRQIGAIESNGKTYTVIEHPIKDRESLIILCKTVLSLKMKAYYEPSDFASVPQMFPFKFELNTDLIYGSNEFEVGNFGGNPVILA
ncbi:MAG: hypothetical protein IKP68_02495 [Clostridia bacterium]|nr:hypothetical protein [Clostridia bacterium]